jgi:hypothetical protein
MFNSPILDVAIGLAFVLLLISLLVSAVCEMLSGILKWRADFLWRGLENLLQSRDARDALYGHALIKGLTQSHPVAAGAAAARRWFDPRRWLSAHPGPSYIPARTFALALIDVIRRPHEVAAAVSSRLDEVVSQAGTDPLTVVARATAILDGALADSKIDRSLKERIQSLKLRLASNDDARQAVAELRGFLAKKSLTHALDNADPSMAGLVQSLRPLLEDAAGDVDRFRENVEIWFNDGMDRVGGWYKRHTTLWQAGIGFVLAVVLNVDALLITRTLWRDPTLRQTLVSQAQAYANEPHPSLERPSLEFSPQTRSSAPMTVRLSSSQLSGGETATITILIQASSEDRELHIERQTANIVFSESADAPPDTWQSPLNVKIPKDAPEKKVFARLKNRVQAESLEEVRVTLEDPKDPVVVNAKLVAARTPDERFDAVRASAANLGLPIGWRACDDKTANLATPLLWCARDGSGHWEPSVLVTIPAMLLGWMLTAAAVSLGAPFWFDALKRIMSIRSAGKAPEERPLAPKQVQQAVQPGQRPKDADAQQAPRT